jgi:hypothetical protein
MDISLKRTVVRLDCPIRIDAVALLGRVPVRDAFERNVRYGVIEINVAVDTSTGILKHSLAERVISDARATKGVKRNVRISKTAVGEQRERAAKAMACEADLRSRITVSVSRDSFVNRFPYGVQRPLEPAMDKTGLTEQVRHE